MASQSVPSSSNENNDDDMSFWTKRNLRFRILILGRANAGKTTILERLTGTSMDNAEVWRNGEKRTDQVIKGENARGLHNVEDEIRFQSKPGFVFHDSRGFEAGADNELLLAQNFVESRSTEVKDLRHQLHAIWMCLPLDESRELFESEKQPFRWVKGTTPLIVIFTKRDGAITKATQRIKQTLERREGMTDRAFNKEVRRRAATEVDARVEERKAEMMGWDCGTGGLGFVTIGEMNEDTAVSAKACDDLVNRTQERLCGPIVKSLLSIVWGRNILERGFWCLYWYGSAIQMGQSGIDCLNYYRMLRYNRSASSRVVNESYSQWSLQSRALISGENVQTHCEL